MAEESFDVKVSGGDMHCRTRLFKRAAFVACAALTLTTLAAGAARAQVVTDTTRPNEVSTPVPPSDLSKLKEPRGDSRGSRPSYRDVEREFERLQLANPALHQTGVVDSGKSVEASRDLEEIISLSERIRKCAEVLTKTPVKK